MNTVIISLFFILVCTFHNCASNLLNLNNRCVYSVKTSETCSDSITFKVELIDTVYYYNDTVNILFKVKNNKSRIVYIISPEWRYWRPLTETIWDSLNCQYIYDFGGTWYFNEGYDNSMRLIILQPNEEYSLGLRFIVKHERNDKNCYISRVLEWKDELGSYNRTISFFVGYVPEINKIKILKKDSGFYDFIDIESGYNFEINLKRIHLGPLWFRVRDKK